MQIYSLITGPREHRSKGRGKKCIFQLSRDLPGWMHLIIRNFGDQIYLQNIHNCLIIIIDTLEMLRKIIVFSIIIKVQQRNASVCLVVGKWSLFNVFLSRMPWGDVLVKFLCGSFVDRIVAVVGARCQYPVIVLDALNRAPWLPGCGRRSCWCPGASLGPCYPACLIL